MRNPLPRTGILLLVALALAPAAEAADWPMWRYDAGRTGASPQELPAKLHLHWVRSYPPLQAAWPDQEKMQFDVVYTPVVAGHTLYLNSARHDCVRALDTRTGDEKWTFHTDGPVRFAPVVWEDRLYFSCDDGYLYCLDGAAGRLLWKVRGGPSDRKILGNERLISTWPARGAPVIADGNVYFAASIWPFMGVFIHALDARTGQVVWTNDGDGSLYMKQPHNTDAFASIAPQGPLVVAGNRLLLPGGRSIPACLDRKTGKLLKYQLAENGKRGGGSEVAAFDKYFFNGGALFELDSEKFLGDYGKQVVLTPEAAYVGGPTQLKVYDLKNAGMKEVEPAEPKDKGKEKNPKEKDPKEKEKAKPKRWVMDEITSCKTPAVEAIIKAGPRLYIGTKGKVVAIDVDLEEKALTPGWEAEVEGTVARLVAADDRLFAVTREGKLHCFSAESEAPSIRGLPKPAPPVNEEVEQKVANLLEATGVRDGWCIVWGIGKGAFLRELAKQSNLRIVAIEPREEVVARWRTRFTEEDLYGTRISIVQAAPHAVQLPPYLASLMVCEDISLIGNHFNEEFLARAYQTVRPYGGTMAFFPHPHLRDSLQKAKLPVAKTKEIDEMTLVVRAGPLPGAANWTHEHADAANTRVSRDQIVKAPLGVLWFGGPSHDGILPRHGHGPQPQVIDGRLIIEGVDLLRAIDIYTGRLLWEAKLPGVGQLYNNLAHQPGANAIGSNYACTSDSIYVVHGEACVRLDPATGKRLGEFRLPSFPDAKPMPLWGYLNVAGDYLIGGGDPLFDPKLLPKPAKDNGDDKEPREVTGTLSKLLKSFTGVTENFSASRHLVVMDRHTGKVLWTASAQNTFRHNATCVGGGKLFTIDRPTCEQMARFKLNDESPPAPLRVRAFDLKTGKELWTADEHVFGTWLSYSEKHDVLVESGRVARDTLIDEPKGMRAYSGKDGKVIWYAKEHVGPAMIHGDTILQDQGGCDLLTGKVKMREDPITGQTVPWKWQRNHGCNTPSASEHLMTFRSGAAGYFDLCNDGGTGNFGGFRSSCTNNLIVAGGVLTAPEYTRTCTCSYQNQTSIGLVNMPEAEMWTFFGTKEVKGPVRRLGLNFAAPGDRKAEGGTLWLEHPSIGGISPAVTVSTKPGNLELFRRHPSTVAGPLNWVASSGLKGVTEVAVALSPDEKSATSYTVRLVFAEPDNLKAGERVFNVEVQGRAVLKDFDIVKEAGGAGKSLIREVTGVLAKDRLTIRLTPSAQATVRSPVLCGVELIAEPKK